MGPSRIFGPTLLLGKKSQRALFFGISMIMFIFIQHFDWICRNN
jgi:hypothetical protein